MPPEVIAAIVVLAGAVGYMGKKALDILAQVKNEKQAVREVANNGGIQTVSIGSGKTATLIRATGLVERLASIEKSCEVIPDMERRISVLEQRCDATSSEIDEIHEWLDPKRTNSVFSMMQQLHRGDS